MLIKYKEEIFFGQPQHSYYWQQTATALRGLRVCYRQRAKAAYRLGRER